MGRPHLLTNFALPENVRRFQGSIRNHWPDDRRWYDYIATDGRRGVWFIRHPAAGEKWWTAIQPERDRESPTITEASMNRLALTLRRLT